MSDPSQSGDTQGKRAAADRLADSAQNGGQTQAQTPGQTKERSDLEQTFSALIKRARSGDSLAYRELLMNVQKALTAYFKSAVARVGGHDAAWGDDLTQETLIAIHTKFHTYSDDRPFLPWMYTIARYKLIDFGRKRRPEAGWVGLDDVLEFVTADQAEHSARDLHAVMSTLTDRERSLLEMLKVHGLSVSEVAEKTGLSESNIKVIVHRTLKRLRQQEGRE